MKHTAPIRFDAYIIETLMRDLVSHDKQPSAFLVYLLLHARSRGGRRAVVISLREIADETGLSKSVVQTAVQNLIRRQLVAQKAAHSTATRVYRVFQPWRRLRRSSYDRKRLPLSKAARARPQPSTKVRVASL